MTLQNLLITGATGQQGGAVITAFRAQSPQISKIFALTRNKDSQSALNLASQGISLIQGDISSSTAIFEQLPALHGVFLVTLPGPHEQENAISFINAAIESRVKHIVFTSVDRGGPARSETEELMLIPHFGVKRDIEKYLKTACALQTERGKDVVWTILRPTSFMDNLAPGFVGRVAATALKQMRGTRMSLVSVKDIGRVAAKAFGEPNVLGGSVLTLTGDLLTFEEMNEIFRDDIGKDIPVTYEFIANALQWAIDDLEKTMEHFRTGAYDYEMTRELSKELGMRSFRTWLREDSNFVTLQK